MSALHLTVSVIHWEDIVSRHLYLFITRIPFQLAHITNSQQGEKTNRKQKGSSSSNSYGEKRQLDRHIWRRD